MSLIVTTSRVSENNSAGAIGTEKPGDYTNFFRSPILIEPDSEIAVDSVKIQRTGNITTTEDNFFTHYFGTDPEAFPNLDGKLYAGSNPDQTSAARMIRMPQTTKSLEGYASLVQTRLNSQYDDPRIYGTAFVNTNNASDGTEEGLTIGFVDRGSASTATSNVTASLSATPVFNIAAPFLGSESDSFTWSVGTGEFTKIGAGSPSLNTSECVGMLTGRPFGMNEGKFQVNCSNASAQPWAIGLSRPQIQVQDQSGTIFPIDSETAPNKDDDTSILDFDGGGNILRGPYEVYDYAVMSDGAGEISITNRVWDPVRNVSRHQEISYWTTGGTVTTAKMTKSKFYASYDGIEFEGDGDNMSISFKQKGKTVYDLIVAISLGNGNTAITALRPLGSTSAALYPMIHLGSGNVTVIKYDSNFVGLNEAYLFPEWTPSAGSVSAKYVPGSDMFSNEALEPYRSQSWVSIPPERSLSRGTVLKCDSSQSKIYVETDTGLDPADTFLIVDYKHVLSIGKFNQTNVLNTLVESQEFPNMGFKLGFADRAILESTDAAGYVTGDGTLVVEFTSTGELDKTAQSSFIRLPGLNHTSYNGGQSGISKIIYQVPQFSNDGRQYGPLFFQPGEKTYVKLNNPGAIILNQLQVQFVDAQERNGNSSLMGETQVVLHVRKSR